MYKEKWNALTPQKQKMLQIVVGILLAVCSSLFIFLRNPNTAGGFLDINTLIAIGLVLLVPRLLENQVGAVLSTLRKYMIIFFAAGLIIMVSYFLITNKF